jgi:glycosyltransferase involved in cell wall biosynthesis
MHELTCLFFPDLYPWEREAIEPVANALAGHYRVNLLDVSENAEIQTTAPVVWVIAKDWKAAIRKLRLAGKNQRVVASVFGLQIEKRAIAALLWARLTQRAERNFSLLTHSPLNFRFYCELEGMESSRVSYLPLPFYSKKESEAPAAKSEEINVGTFGAFLPETNLNYFLNVAHYVLKRKPEVKFRMLGAGPLYDHIFDSAKELGLSESVIVTETLAAEDLDGIDIQIYAPVRNDHFVPLYLGASRGLPILSSDVPGISSFIQDGKNGFVVATNETKPMGELVLRLAENAALRKFVGEELKRSLTENFAATTMLKEYERLFFNTSKISAVSSLQAA